MNQGAPKGMGLSPTLIWGGFCGCDGESYSLRAEMLIYESPSVMWQKNKESKKYHMTPTLRTQNSPRAWTSNHECEAHSWRSIQARTRTTLQCVTVCYSVLQQITAGPSTDQSFLDQTGKLLNDCERQSFFGLKKLKTIVMLLFLTSRFSQRGQIVLFQAASWPEPLLIGSGGCFGTCCHGWHSCYISAASSSCQGRMSPSVKASPPLGHQNKSADFWPSVCQRL